MVHYEMPDAQAEWLKFDISQNISTHSKEYNSAQEALYAPLAKKIFGFPWAEAVKVEPQAVWVKKQSWVDWEILAEPLSGLIEEHLQAQFKKSAQIEENPEAPKAVSVDDPLFQKVAAVIETEVNPNVASHGGRVALLEVKDSKAFVRLEGGCQGCAMSQATLKEGIEVAVRKAVPEITQVLDITDHAGGSNPYFVQS